MGSIARRRSEAHARTGKVGKSPDKPLHMHGLRGRMRGARSIAWRQNRLTRCVQPFLGHPAVVVLVLFLLGSDPYPVFELRVKRWRAPSASQTRRSPAAAATDGRRRRASPSLPATAERPRWQRRLRPRTTRLPKLTKPPKRARRFDTPPVLPANPGLSAALASTSNGDLICSVILPGGFS